MAVGKQGSKEVTITYDDSPAGTPRIITNFAMELGGAKIVVETEQSEAFGDAWREHMRTGMRSVPDIPCSGTFDTTATTGPHVVLRPLDADAEPMNGTRTLVIVFGDAKTFTVETILAEYEVLGQNGNLTRFNALIRPTGAGVWT
jgi:hypothetical protein